jgi:hypothetical protein
MPVIPATQEAETRIAIHGQHGQKVSEILAHPVNWA